MAQTKAPTLTDFIHDPDCEGHVCQCAVREIGWVAHESREGVDLNSPRGQAYLARKRALLAYVFETQR